jgi:hypothetical protein
MTFALQKQTMNKNYVVSGVGVVSITTTGVASALIATTMSKLQ